MMGLYRSSGPGVFDDVSMPSGIGTASRNTLGFGCMFLDVDLDGSLDLAVANGHIDETVRNIRGNTGYAQAPQLFLNRGGGRFRDVAESVGGGFETPKVGRGLAYGDFDRDGDLDILLMTNNGPAYLYRNDQVARRRSIRFHLQGSKSNRDAIGSSVRIFHEGQTQSRMVRGGSSYLSQSELPVTFGLGLRDKIDRVVFDWPSGRTEEYKDLNSGKSYKCMETKGIEAQSGF
jgi:enediyne biosynthesis protein E4